MGELTILLFVLLLLGGATLGWMAFFKVRQLSVRLEDQERLLQRLITRLDGEGKYEEPARADSKVPIDDSSRTKPVAAHRMTHGQADIIQTEDPWKARPEDDTAQLAPDSISRGEPFQAPTPGWLLHLQEQWMAWLGGLCIALAGIFLVRYTIEQDLLGPTARITLAVTIGLVLHAMAEWLRQRNRGHYQALAALAGGASITLFAALLAALHLYALMPPLPAFVLLTLVSLLTMALAVLHGPLLAIMGLLGAYAVPLLVDTGSGSITGILMFALLISAAALALMQFVYRFWLWSGMLVGALSWWFLSLSFGDADPLRGLYLVLLSYLIIAMPTRDWLLNKAGPDVASSEDRFGFTDAATIAEAPVRETLLLILLAFAVSIYANGDVGGAIYYWSPLILLLFYACRSRKSLTWLPWYSLLLQLTAWFALGLNQVEGTWQVAGLSGNEQNGFLIYAGWMAALHFGLALWLARTQERFEHWISLALLAPLLWLALSYLLVTELHQSLMWSALSLLFGVVYLGLASWRLKSRPQNTVTVWLTIAGHFAYSLAATILLREASMTLALAAQLLSLAWVIRRFNLPRLDMLLKLVLAVVVARLTLNPWLLTYPADIHWSWWSYGGATLFCALAAWQTDHASRLRQWLEAATLHLLVLTLFAEVRYWLYGGNVFAPRLELLEMAINSALWSSLGLMYFHRSRFAEHLAPLYIFLARILMVLALGGYALLVLVLNPYWGESRVAETPIFNELLLAYGAPILISTLAYRFYEPRFRSFAAVCCGGFTFLFVTMQIRHLWQGTLDLGLRTGNGELYTYSAVWLVLAVAAMLAGAARYGNQVYRLGLALLFLVIAKLFLVDMADLDGLLRVASFMGLGLCLLGLAYLYQRFSFRHRV